ncbi:hypothetical protein NJB1604_39420 [Mycobacterium marinum]|uniref:hypothetical protein n=1 Tax=Mycobacterium marinum TaxID=1781 RepID=UPI0021C39F0E|nr:hypothetical protein [Mycobacterium marinum]GJO51408.1 hypothetical protein NJB1604_39420 [Mycobacterium marinum]
MSARRGFTLAVAVAWLVGVGLLSGCGADTSTGRPTSSSSSSAKPAYDGSAYAASVHQAVLEGFPDFKSTADACTAGVGWVCAIDTIQSPSERTIKVKLKPEQVWISLADTTDWYKWGEEVARNIYHFVDAAGTFTGTCWQQTVAPPNQIDVYESSGDTAFLSPAGFPPQRQRHPNAC